jgi:hypothetical protein
MDRADVPLGTGQREHLVQRPAQPLPLVDRLVVLDPGPDRDPVGVLVVAQRARQVVQPQQQRRERIAHLVGRLGDEPALLFERGTHRGGHLVERPGESSQLRGAAGLRGAAVEGAAGDRAGGGVQAADRAQHPAGQQGGDTGEHHDRDDPGEREPDPRAADPGPQLARRRDRDDQPGDPGVVTAAERDRDHQRGGVPGPEPAGVLGAAARQPDLDPLGDGGIGQVDGAGLDQDGLVPVEDDDGDAVHLVVALQLLGQRRPAVLAVHPGPGLRGELVGVIEAVDEHPLLRGRGIAAGQRDQQGRDDQGDEGQQQAEQA